MTNLNGTNQRHIEGIRIRYRFFKEKNAHGRVARIMARQKYGYRWP